MVTQAKKKQTPNVRKILYAKKNLRDWLEELVRASLLIPRHGDRTR